MVRAAFQGGSQRSIQNSILLSRQSSRERWLLHDGPLEQEEAYLSSTLKMAYQGGLTGSYSHLMPLSRIGNKVSHLPNRSQHLGRQLNLKQLKKSRKSHCRIFKEFICKLWWKISIWSPTNKQDCWLSQTCNFFFKRLLCPPLVTCINAICLNSLSV